MLIYRVHAGVRLEGGSWAITVTGTLLKRGLYFDKTAS